MEKLIEDYRIEVVEAGCAPGSGRYGLRIDLPNDISAVLPYVNALVRDARYDPAENILIWGEADRRQVYALRPRDIRLARVAGIEDPEQAGRVAREIVDRLNCIWADRRNIAPRFTERKLPSTLDIFKLLPRTNCRQCGFLTCLAFAAAVRSGGVGIERCPPLAGPDFAASRAAIAALLASS